MNLSASFWGTVAPVPTERTLPSLDPPNEEGHVHVVMKGDTLPLCGYKGRLGRHQGLDYDGERVCPHCGAPVCPTCRDIDRAMTRSGIVP